MTATRIATSVVNTGLSSVAKVVTIAKHFSRRKEKRKVQNENNDLISREALRKALHNFFDGKVIDEPAYILRDVFCHIDNAPTVDIPTELCKGCRFLKDCETCEDKIRPQGEWKPISFQFECNLCECFCAYKANFCPNCGAKMKGGAE